MSVLTDILGGGDLIKEIGQTIRQIIPDPAAQHDFDLKMATLADQADAREAELQQGQIDVDKVEAGNSNLFVAGWRPAIGWVGAASLGYTWILAPLVKWGCDVSGHVVPLPSLSPDQIYPIILALLGVGTMRTVEKLNGVATSLGGNVMTPLSPVPGPAAASDPTVTATTPPVKKGWFH